MLWTIKIAKKFVKNDNKLINLEHFEIYVLISSHQH